MMQKHRIAVYLRLSLFLALIMIILPTTVYAQTEIASYKGFVPKGKSDNKMFVDAATSSDTYTFVKPAVEFKFSKLHNVTSYHAECYLSTGERFNIGVNGKTSHKTDVPATTVKCILVSDGKYDAEIIMHSYVTADGTKPPDPVDPKPPVTGGFGYNSYYDAARDRYRVDLWGMLNGSDKVELVYTASSGQQYKKVYPAADLKTLYLACNGNYQINVLDAAGAIKHKTSSISTSAIKNSTCSSTVDTNVVNDLNARVTVTGCSPNEQTRITWDKSPTDTHYNVYKDGKLVTTTKDNFYDVADGSGSYTIEANDGRQSDVNVNASRNDGNDQISAIADALCNCIRELKPVLDDIAANTAGQLDELKKVNGHLVKINDQLTDVNAALDDINRHLTPTTDIKVPTVAIPSLDDFKPAETINSKYVDNNTYFKPNGVLPTPGPMPQAPEPTKNWTDGQGGIVDQQKELSKDKPLSQTAPLTKDSPLTQQKPLTQSNPLTQHKPLVKDPPLVQNKQQYQPRWKQ